MFLVSIFSTGIWIYSIQRSYNLTAATSVKVFISDPNLWFMIIRSNAYHPNFGFSIPGVTFIFHFHCLGGKTIKIILSLLYVDRANGFVVNQIS